MTYAELTIPADELKLNMEIPELENLSDADVSDKYLLQSKANLTDDVMIELNISDESAMDDILFNNNSLIKKCLKLIQRRNIAMNMANIAEGSIFYMLLDNEYAEYNALKKKFKYLTVSKTIPVTRPIIIKNLFG